MINVVLLQAVRDHVERYPERLSTCEWFRTPEGWFPSVQTAHRATACLGGRAILIAKGWDARLDHHPQVAATELLGLTQEQAHELFFIWPPSSAIFNRQSVVTYALLKLDRLIALGKAEQEAARKAAAVQAEREARWAEMERVVAEHDESTHPVEEPTPEETHIPAAPPPPEPSAPEPVAVAAGSPHSAGRSGPPLHR